MEAKINSIDTGVPPRRKKPHYHGYEVRTIFVISALVILIAQSTGTILPLTTMESVGSAMLLVITAGITNPAQKWIHWLNAIIAIYGTLLFGTTAIDNYRIGVSIFNTSFLYIEALAILSLIALYFTVRTIRGLLQNKKFFNL